MVVMYHGIDLVQNTEYNLRFFSRDVFEKHIRLYRRHCNILSHSDFINQNYSDEKLNIVITFDDGYLNNRKYALPILEKYRAHAYFFITGVDNLPTKVLWADAMDIVLKRATSQSKVSVSGIDFHFVDHEFINKDSGLNLKTFIRASRVAGPDEKENIISQLLSIYDFRKNEKLADYWQLMRQHEIRETSESKYITIGSHGFYHNNLGSLSNADAVAEFLKSRAYLENITQKEIDTIAFPDGSYTEQLNQSLSELGVKKQFLVEYNFSDAGNKDYVYDRLGLYPYMGNANAILHKIIY